MSIEVTRILVLVIGGGLAIFLAIAPRLACRLYAQAVVKGRNRTAGFWAFLAVGGGHSPKA